MGIQDAVPAPGQDNFSFKTIPLNQTITVRQYQEMIVTQFVTVDGTLNLIGDITILEM